MSDPVIAKIETMPDALQAGMRVAVLMGGPGSEREVSLVSGKAVVEALSGNGLEVLPVEVAGYDVEFPGEVDIAFNVIHGTFGEDGGLQALLDARGIPYTGAGAESSRLAFDKLASKERFLAAGVPTPRHEILKHGQVPTFNLPLVVKPLCEGSSVGVHIVHEPAQLASALADVVKFGEVFMVEEYVAGKELTVGILGDRALPIVHICPRSGFYDMSNKYPWMSKGGETDYFCPADLSAAVTASVQKAALDAHRALGIEVYSRVDILLDQDECPWVLEVNTIPGMTASSLLPKAAAAAGLPFNILCLDILKRSKALRNT